MPFERVTLLGLGLIGGSLGLAMRDARLARQITGYDPAPGIGQRARALGAIDAASTSPSAAAEGADLVIKAVTAAGNDPDLWRWGWQRLEDVMGHNSLASLTSARQTGGVAKSLQNGATSSASMRSRPIVARGRPMARRERAGSSGG